MSERGMGEKGVGEIVLYPCPVGDKVFDLRLDIFPGKGAFDVCIGSGFQAFESGGDGVSGKEQDHGDMGIVGG